jgi:hypothetical protein
LSIAHFKKTAAVILVASEDQLVTYDLIKQSVVDVIISKKKSQGQAIPTHLEISFDDQYSLEATSQVITLRNLKTKQIIAKYEGHLYPVQHIQFAPTTHAFVSAANSECMLWNPKEHLKSGGDQIVEISQPDKIFDQASSDPITSVVLKEIGDDKTYMIAVQTDSTSSVFYTKSIGNSNKASAGKSKTVKKECTVRLAAASEEFINA